MLLVRVGAVGAAVEFLAGCAELSSGDVGGEAAGAARGAKCCDHLLGGGPRSWHLRALHICAPQCLSQWRLVQLLPLARPPQAAEGEQAQTQAVAGSPPQAQSPAAAAFQEAVEARIRAAADAARFTSSGNS